MIVGAAFVVVGVALLFGSMRLRGWEARCWAALAGSCLACGIMLAHLL